MFTSHSGTVVPLVLSIVLYSVTAGYVVTFPRKWVTGARTQICLALDFPPGPNDGVTLEVSTCINHQLGRLVSESACEQEDPGSNTAPDMVDAARNTAWDLGKQPNNYRSNYPTQEWARRFVPIASFYSIHKLTTAVAASNPGLFASQASLLASRPSWWFHRTIALACSFYQVFIVFK
ncbi:hypothetical protein FHG87_004065 [Trinorchestia longiramus]|nr:hypothetical protein FHG87_004065 [Trinorchestia longiramus]